MKMGNVWSVVATLNIDAAANAYQRKESEREPLHSIQFLCAPRIVREGAKTKLSSSTENVPISDFRYRP